MNDALQKVVDLIKANDGLCTFNGGCIFMQRAAQKITADTLIDASPKYCRNKVT
jgi:hypothetical protein